MEDMIVMPAAPVDKDALADLFYAHLAENAEYISHGEMQMGIGHLVFNGEEYVPELDADSRRLWLAYIEEHIVAEGMAVYKAEDFTGKLLGFCVLETDSDGGAPFGVLCDILVNADARGRGVGSRLFSAAEDWFMQRNLKDVYLESGKNNHNAHAFFMRRGFKKVSEVYHKCTEHPSSV